MQAAYYTRQGKPAEVIQVGEQPTPHAGAGEVRVCLHASAVNPADSNRTVGRTYACGFITANAADDCSAPPPSTSR